MSFWYPIRDGISHDDRGLKLQNFLLVRLMYVYKQNKEKNPCGKVVKSRKLQLQEVKILKKNTRFFMGEMFECITPGGAVVSMESYLP